MHDIGLRRTTRPFPTSLLSRYVRAEYTGNLVTMPAQVAQVAL
jgi:hypothetical protein